MAGRRLRPGGPLSARLHSEPRRSPRLESAVDVGRAPEPEILELGSGQAGLKTLVTDEDEQSVKAVAKRWVAVSGRGIKPPLQHVTRNEVRTGDHAVAVDVDVLREEIRRTYTDVTTHHDQGFVLPTGREWADERRLAKRWSRA